MEQSIKSKLKLVDQDGKFFESALFNVYIDSCEMVKTDIKNLYKLYIDGSGIISNNQLCTVKSSHNDETGIFIYLSE